MVILFMRMLLLLQDNLIGLVARHHLYMLLFCKSSKSYILKLTPSWDLNAIANTLHWHRFCCSSVVMQSHLELETYRYMRSYVHHAATSFSASAMCCIDILRFLTCKPAKLEALNGSRFFGIVFLCIQEMSYLPEAQGSVQMKGHTSTSIYKKIEYTQSSP